MEFLIELGIIIVIGMVLIFIVGIIVPSPRTARRELEAVRYLDSIQVINKIREKEKKDGKSEVLRERQSEVPQSDNSGGDAGQVEESDSVGTELYGGNGIKAV